MITLRQRCGLLPAGLALALLATVQASAKPQEIRISSESDLSFGTFMVFGTGSRSVSTTGAVIDTAIVAVEGSSPRPARFTVQYDRGNESKQALDITVEIVMAAPASVRNAGVDARLSALETDLPGHSRVVSGEAITLRLTNCRSRVCSRSFAVGGRLDITRNFGGAKVEIPITIDARIVEREQQ